MECSPYTYTVAQASDGSTAYPLVRKQRRARVPDGVAPYYKTRQMPPNEKGFVGFETVWEPMHKEAEYKTPKKP